MLNLDPERFGVADPLPFGWHFFLLGGETQRSALREDGFPGFGVPMPDLGLPRLLLGGRKVEQTGALRIGASISKSGRITKVTEKDSPAGRLAIVEVENTLRDIETSSILRETQTYLMLEQAKGTATTAAPAAQIKADFKKQVTADATLLFQYSALGFNSHKIHLDRLYAQQVEGLPDLVVNGGLATLLVTESLRMELGATVTGIATRHTAPLFIDRPMTIAADRSDTGWSVRVYDDADILAASMEVTCR
jgi:3-methylfumaryl-CoA hydratase